MALLHWLQNPRPRLILAALLVALSFTTLGCPDDDDDDDPDVGIDVGEDVEEDADEEDVEEDADEEDVEEDADAPDIPEGMARVQFVHNVPDPDGSTVDVYLGDELTIDDFDFRTATPYLDIDEGTYDVAFAPDDSTEVGDAFETFEGVEFDEGVRYHVVANGVTTPDDFEDNPDGADIGLALFTFDNALEDSVDPGVGQMVLFHGAPDAPTIDLQVGNETELVSGLSYGEFSDGYLTLPPGVTAFDILINEDGSRFNSYQTPDIEGGEAYIGVASGFVDETQNEDAPFEIVVFATPVGGDDRVEGIILEEAARAQIVHDSPDPALAPIDLFINGSLVTQNINYRSATPFLTVVAGQDLDFAFTPAGAAGPDESVLSETYTFDNGSANIIVASGVMTPDDYPDNPDGADTAVALYRLAEAQETADGENVELVGFHSILDAPEVTVVAIADGDEVELVDSLGYGSFSTYGALTPDAGTTIELRDPGDDSVIAEFEVDTGDLAGDASLVVFSGLADPDAATDEDAPGVAAVLVGPDGSASVVQPVE